MDLFPCVEDPEKLSYLDLEGCFGDLCDLSNCTYLGMISRNNVDTAIQKMLQERWSYDGLDEEEDGEEDDYTNSALEIDQEDSKFQSTDPTQSIVNELFGHRNRTSSLYAVQKESSDSATASDTDEEERIEKRSSSSQILSPRIERIIEHEAGEDPENETSKDVLFRDDQVANTELVTYYYDIACKGGTIHLKSVSGEFKEDVL